MQYFEWLGISPSTSIHLIKRISKKKIKQEDFDNLEITLKENWIKYIKKLEQYGEAGYLSEVIDYSKNFVLLFYLQLCH